MRTPSRAWLALLLPVSLVAHSAQVLNAEDDKTVLARISQKETTRIRVEGAPITDVVGNIAGGGCANAAKSAEANAPGVPGAPPAPPPPIAHPGGDIHCLAVNGQIFVRLAAKPKPVNLFVSTASATYTLLLTPVDMPADTIVLRDRTRKLAAAPATGRSASGHVRALKAMLAAMASERPAADMRVEAVTRDVALWQEARFTLTKVYTARGLRGEAYRLTNVSDRPMTLAEQEFHRPGVLGVSIEQHSLAPAETTSVYVIRSEGAE